MTKEIFAILGIICIIIMLILIWYHQTHFRREGLFYHENDLKKIDNALSKEDKDKADKYVKETVSNIIKDALDKDYSQKGRSGNNVR